MSKRLTSLESKIDEARIVANLNQFLTSLLSTPIKDIHHHQHKIHNFYPFSTSHTLISYLLEHQNTYKYLQFQSQHELFDLDHFNINHVSKSNSLCYISSFTILNNMRFFNIYHSLPSTNKIVYLSS
jgi:hypothetical protein